MSFGPFFRAGNIRTQPLRTAKLQARSGELWGTTPFGGMEPTVQAYCGHLPEDKEGIEFYTQVEPQSYRTSPMTGVREEARWFRSLDKNGEVLEAAANAVKIKIEIVKKRYSCKSARKTGSEK
jgi:hypothetical protein